MLLTEDQVHRLDTLRLDLQSPHRLGTKRYLSMGVSLAQFIAMLALDHAAEIEQELLEEEGG